MRRNAHIAMISIPVASVINPVLPITSALIRRGHRVTYVASDPYLPRIEAIGAEIIKYRFGLLTGYGQDEYSFCRLATNTLAAAMPAFERDKPDLILYDFVAFAAPILARKLQTPAVRISPYFAFSRRTLEVQMPHETHRHSVLQGLPRVDQFLAQHGIHVHDFVFHREPLNIHVIPRAFDPCAETYDDSCLYAGRCAPEFSFGNWRKPEKSTGRPIVLVAGSKSFSQGLDYYQLCIAAFAGLNWHVVLSVPDDADTSVLHPLPDNFEIVKGISHTKVLPHASLFVFMGGMTAANEAAYHGVPLVMTSVGVSELEWLADSVARLGVGAHLRGPEPNPSLLRRAAVETLQSATVSDSARRLRDAVRREAGGEEVANRIEEFLAV